MSDIIDCPSCNRKLRVPEELIGQAVKCPTCGITFTATSGVTESAPPPGRRESLPSRPLARELPSTEPEYEDDEPREERRSSARPAPPPAYSHHDEDSPRWSRRSPDQTPHRGTLILVLGILSILFPCGLVGLILGPIAWVMGNTDLREIRAGRMDAEGESATNAGRICGIIGTLLHASLFCCGGVWFFAIIAAGAGH